jgi:hypothetical protein
VAGQSGQKELYIEPASPWENKISARFTVRPRNSTPGATDLWRVPSKSVCGAFQATLYWLRDEYSYIAAFEHLASRVIRVCISFSASCSASARSTPQNWSCGSKAWMPA